MGVIGASGKQCTNDVVHEYAGRKSGTRQFRPEKQKEIVKAYPGLLQEPENVDEGKPGQYVCCCQKMSCNRDKSNQPIEALAHRYLRSLPVNEEWRDIGKMCQAQDGIGYSPD